MQGERLPIVVGFARGLLLTAVLSGCASQPQPDRSSPQASTTQADGTRPFAIAFGKRIDLPDIAGQLAEARGGEILEETILDLALAGEAAKAGLTFPPTAAETEAERRIVVLTVAEESQVSQDQAAGLIDDLCRARGVGPLRFAAQLRRNAVLRSLVRDSISVSPDEVSLSRRLNFGDRVRARLILVRTEREASELRSTLGALPTASVRAEFARLALERSIHVSAPQAGDLGVISPEDPALPVPLQQELAAAPQGAITQLVATGEGYQFAFVEARISPQSPPTDADIERRVRLRKERIAMDELSNRLIAGAQVTVFNPSLRWSWERRR
ncbi:MAG: peptidylprolyl isomerase [Phycisphaerales bacterium]